MGNSNSASFVVLGVDMQAFAHSIALLYEIIYKSETIEGGLGALDCSI